MEVLTRTAFPQQWATTQNNLATAYSDRILGERAENIEQAIAAYRAALEVRTRTAFPQEWAITQNNLGNAYFVRILGERAENIEQAIAAYRAALEVLTRTAFPQQWATTQNNLAIAYKNRILGERAENIEQAIAAYRAALEVRTRTAFPQDWAMTQNNLGEAYRNRILGERAENIEQAIAAYRAALEVRTRTAFPQDWAMTQNNLGNAYSDRILGERAENIEQAIAAYRAALEVRTRTAFPQSNAETLFNLGRLYQEESQFNSAYNTFAQAIETVEFIRGEINSGEEAKRKQAEEWNALYRCMVEVCLALNKDTEAIEYIERSKTRNLVELLTKAASTTPENLPTVNSSIQFTEIQHLLDNKTAIIQWYIFNDCFRAFIITRNNQPIIWQSEKQDLDNLFDWIKNYLLLYFTDKPKWRSELNAQLSQLTQILHLNQITSLIPSHCSKLILIPHRYLHLLPLQAIPLSAHNSTTPEYLFDKFPGGVSYAPSCQLLRFTQHRAKQLDNSPLNQQSHLFAIQNPSNDLPFTDIEVETIATDFQPYQILKHQQATKTALATPSTNQTLTNSQWLHFSCHGYFNFDSPLKSGLQLANAVVSKTPANSNSSRHLRVDDEKYLDLEKCLTLEDIFQLNLNNCRLVCLSACETGLIDSTNNSDEYIGLASGFISAGAANIISTLWAVSDFHTALLMIKFYENLPNHQYNMPLALNNTQKWLRQATQAQIIDWLKNLNNMQLVQKQSILKVLETEYKPEQQPFKKPEYWAAFCAISPVYTP
ncbi:CHAT domain-containing protein [Fortiea sp. LEGE XX443]|uniref:CHAT domain-containing protein n=1 Tax=Fortiea sp. LEGE XX443 TaxID=1828611 RepID=UPI001D133114|nr:CHAT domain-containing protein [Fortiea sp. LEGE XX443]